MHEIFTIRPPKKLGLIGPTKIHRKNAAHDPSRNSWIWHVRIPSTVVILVVVLRGDVVMRFYVSTRYLVNLFGNVTDINNIGYKVLHVDRCALST